MFEFEPEDPRVTEHWRIQLIYLVAWGLMVVGAGICDPGAGVAVIGYILWDFIHDAVKEPDVVYVDKKPVDVKDLKPPDPPEGDGNEPGAK